MRRYAIAGVLVALLSTVGVLAQQQMPGSSNAANAAPKIVFVRTCTIVDGKGEEAVKWATEIVTTSQPAGPNKPPFDSANVYQERFGPLGRLHFVLTFADFTKLGQFTTEPPPPQVQEMLKQAPMLFRDCKDTVMTPLR